MLADETWRKPKDTFVVLDKLLFVQVFIFPLRIVYIYIDISLRKKKFPLPSQTCAKHVFVVRKD